KHVNAALSLPSSLLHFFRRWTPPQLSALPRAPEPSIHLASTTPSTDPNAPSTDPTAPVSSTTNKEAGWKKNPFLPFKNPSTGKWHGPHYSLRRQAQLYKLAAEHNVLSLMPLSPKHPKVKAQKRLERGLRVKGTGVDQHVKGHKWERTLRSRLDLRKRALEAMPEMIETWKNRGHGRGWKKFP
ncbi:hypothetical protein K470DRAFT_192630, partial [Piedraia hortae CBS 480.64]